MFDPFNIPSLSYKEAAQTWLSINEGIKRARAVVAICWCADKEGTGQKSQARFKSDLGSQRSEAMAQCCFEVTTPAVCTVGIHVISPSHIIPCQTPVRHLC